MAQQGPSGNRLGCVLADVEMQTSVYYSVSTTSAISIPYMYDNSCGHSLGLQLLHYLIYAAACYVSRANDTSASVKRSVGADLDWHSRQMGEPKQQSDV